MCAIVSDDKRHGPGVCIKGDGRYFEGHFVDNELNGNGVAIFNQGMYYEGEMLIHGPNGRGTIFLSAESVRSDVCNGIHSFMWFHHNPFYICRIVWIRTNERQS